MKLWFMNLKVKKTKIPQLSLKFRKLQKMRSP
jgi:hypothetical protein